jgi:REP element-mobilizing transposase RayT
MSKPDYIDFQNRTEPIAYLITIRTYGTWLHGDGRGAVDRHDHHRYRTPRIAANKALVSAEKAQLKHRPVILNESQRVIVEQAIREVCENRSYRLLAVNARTNHVHSVITTPGEPELAMNTFKAYATRHLREAGLLPPNVKPWSRHGSTPYLWTPEEVERAIDYVINGQGDEPFER